jgi:hypothetical protein
MRNLTEFLVLIFTSSLPFQPGNAADDPYCPPETLYYPLNHLCISSTHAIGPFPPVMVAQCQQYNPGNSVCSSERWEIYTAASLRGTGRCAPGSEWDEDLAACLSDELAWGPFTQKQANECKRNGWGRICESMRWPTDVLKGVMNTDDPEPDPKPSPVPSPRPPKGNVNTRLLTYYSQRANYNAVYDDVMGWYGTTSDGCVAFMSTALRHVGVSIPRTKDESGYNVSLWTASFAHYLQHDLAWTRIQNPRDLAGGDVVFSLDSPRGSGIPGHVFMFHSWSNLSGGVGNVVDNQGFLHERNIIYGSTEFTAFGFALRSP